MSAHVACLRGFGLVVARAQGRQVFYALARPELLDLLTAAETLLAATGNAVALCPTYGTDTSTAEPGPTSVEVSRRATRVTAATTNPGTGKDAEGRAPERLWQISWLEAPAGEGGLTGALR